MEISHQNNCYQNIKNNWYFTQVKYIFPKEIPLITYKLLIVPHLNYGLPLLGVNLKDLFLLQKKAIPLVMHNSYTSHTELIFKKRDC